MDDIPGGGSSNPGSPPISLTYTNVGLAFAFVALDAILSLVLNLGIGRSLVTSALRCLVQLWVMGFVLNYVFNARNIWAVAAMTLVLNLLAAYEVTWNKAKRRYSGMFVTTLTAMILSTVPISAVASRFAMAQEPFWTPDRYIPTLGMILGNAISGVGIGVGYTLEQFNSSREKVETLLAHGATRAEACRPVATEALRLALLPVINQMSVIGLISIPGMMTGAILGGQPVDQATKLQTIIIYIISASTAMATLASVLAACTILVDTRGRLHPERAWSTKSKSKTKSNASRNERAGSGGDQARSRSWVTALMFWKRGALRLD